MNDMSDEQLVAEVIERARVAQIAIEHYDQQQVDDLVTAIAWVATRPHNAEHLARQLADSGNQAGKTRVLDVQYLSDTKLATAVRTQAGNLKVIGWVEGR